jgi:hypothetical protein
MAQSFAFFRIDHVYREQNAEADALANEALDETSSRPAKPDAPAAKPQPQKIRARVRNGALVPLDALDLPESAEVEISIRRISKV